MNTKMAEEFLKFADELAKMSQKDPAELRRMVRNWREMRDWARR